jgi:uncharacterized membrane protein YkoI
LQSSKKIRTLIAGGVIAVATVGGVAGIAAAQSSGGSTTTNAASADESPAYKSSVTVPDGPDTGKDDESAESAALQSQAKITPDQAKAAALAAVPGTANKVELENENGNVVYGVEVTDAAGKTTDVKVDAGNGTVLAKDADDDNEAGNEAANEKGETNDAPESPATAPSAPAQ